MVFQLGSFTTEFGFSVPLITSISSYLLTHCRPMYGLGCFTASVKMGETQSRWTHTEIET